MITQEVVEGGLVGDLLEEIQGWALDLSVLLDQVVLGLLGFFQFLLQVLDPGV